jgi:2-dehydro-3-deoxygluconokinase
MLKGEFEQMSVYKPPVDIAVLGEVMIEMAPEDGGCYRLGVAGDTFNTAAALAQLGVSVQYLTMLGQDSYSDKVLERMAELDIGQQWVLRDAERRPGLYLIDNTPDGERQFSYWREHSAARLLFGSKEFLAKALQPLNNIPAVYLSGITLALCTKESRACLFEFLENYSGVIYYDCNYRPALWPDRLTAQTINETMIAMSHVYLPGLDDELSLAGSQDENSVVRRLADQKELESVMTAGASAITLISQGRVDSWRQPSVEKVVDTTGAGDSFNGGYIAARIRGNSLLRSAQFASGVASQVVAQRGGIMPHEKWLPLRQQLESNG